MSVADELERAGYTEHQIAIIDWIQDQLAVDPTLDNRMLLARTRQVEGDVALVSRLRGFARQEFGIVRHAGGGVINVEKYVAAAGPRVQWTPERSAELRALPGWKLNADPHAPPPEPVSARQAGRRRKRSLVETLGAAVVAEGDEAFAIVITELRGVMQRLNIQAVTVDAGSVVVSQRVQLFRAPDLPLTQPSVVELSVETTA